MDDKKSRKVVGSGRPYLLRRSTASGAGGSIKRRSFRLKKGANKESGKENYDARKTSTKDASSDSKRGGIKDVLKEKFSDSRKNSHKDDDGRKSSSRESDVDREYLDENY